MRYNRSYPKGAIMAIDLLMRIGRTPYVTIVAAHFLALCCAQGQGPATQQPKNLAFASDRSGRNQIYTIAIDTSTGTTLTAPLPLTTAGGGNQESREPSWSRAASRQPFAALFPGRIAYQFGAPGVRGIHFVNPDATGDTNIKTIQGDERDPSWSPDGQFVVYSKLLSGSSDYDLWVHNATNPDDSTDYRLLNLPTSLEFRPTWSPDG